MYVKEILFDLVYNSNINHNHSELGCQAEWNFD